MMIDDEIPVDSFDPPLQPLGVRAGYLTRTEENPIGKKNAHKGDLQERGNRKNCDARVCKVTPEDH